MKNLILQGQFTLVKSTYGFVNDENNSYFVARKNFNNANDKDIVDFELFEYKGQLEARIIKVVKRVNDEFVGVIQRNKNFSFVIVKNLYKDVFIPKNKDKNSKTGDIVKIKILDWGNEKLRKKPQGIVVKNFGNKENPEVIVRSILDNKKISTKFSDEILRQSSKSKPFDITNRVDLRNTMHITIDGSDTKDIDDAIYLEKQDNKYILYVSIADVSYYVEKNSKLDLEALNRGNSIYLYDKVIPMLPFNLTNDLCSLNPNEDKLCFTVKLVFNENAKLLSNDFMLSVINSKYKLTYEHVNEILENIDTNEYEYTNMIYDMNELSNKLTYLSKKRGSMDFEIPEIKLILDEKNYVQDVKLRQRKQAEILIENFMIAANIVCAEYLTNLDINAVYRVHEKPDINDLINLNNELKPYGLSVKNPNVLEKKLQSIIDKTKDNEFGYLIHKMILKSMKKAHYEQINKGHFGLNLEYYLHFTSPIRRYSDLVVHRILKNVLFNIKDDNSNLATICKHISKTERVAMDVERQAQSVKLAQYMENKIGDIYDAKVVHISKDKIFVLLNNYVECILLNEKNLKVSDKIQVKITDTNIYEGIIYVKKV